MRAELEAWQASIFDSLEGKDYKEQIDLRNRKIMDAGS